MVYYDENTNMEEFEPREGCWQRCHNCGEWTIPPGTLGIMADCPLCGALTSNLKLPDNWQPPPPSQIPERSLLGKIFDFFNDIF